MLQKRVLMYIDHLEAPVYFASLLKAYKTYPLIQGLLTLLRSNDSRLISATCLLIRDLILIAPRYHLGLTFRTAFFTSDLIPVLEELVLAPQYFTRCDAIYTLGKIGSTGSIPALHHAFSTLRDRDPLFLPRLVGEIWWLETEKSWSLVANMITSPYYGTRWAALGTLATWSGRSDLHVWKRYWYASLHNDTHPFIRAEAAYAYQQLLFEQDLPTLSRAEKRQQRKALDQHKPAISFADIEVWFSNYLYTHQLMDYSVDDFDRFIEEDTMQLVRDRKAYQQHKAQKHT